MRLEDLLTLLPSSDQWLNWFTYDLQNPLLFSSGLFLGMFLVFYAVYILLRGKFTLRLLYVVLFSIFFYYKSSGIFFLLLIGTSILDYYLAGIIVREKRKSLKKIFLALSIISNIGILAYFKYTNFFIESINELSGSDFHLKAIILPVGISFFTFQSISYIIEIYREEVKPAKSYLDYLFYISFFPQLVAGPIVKAKEFLPQIYKPLRLTKEEINEGLLLIVGGLIKKAVISDYISVNFVDRVFDTPNTYSAFENLMAVYGYALQIYCDFSGYSDMAIGLALLLGYRLPINFDVPYQSASITEFWRRWHISLSTWLKEFLYISCGGNRKGSFAGYLFPTLFFTGAVIWGVSRLETTAVPLFIAVGATVVFIVTILFAGKKRKALYTNFNLMTTMLLGGLWHGASLRFIIWGALHGMGLVVHKLFLQLFPGRQKTAKSRPKLWQIIAVLITFHFVCFSWIFFRAKDFKTAVEIIGNISVISWQPEQWLAIIQGYSMVFILAGIGFIWHFIPKKWIQQLAVVFFHMPLLLKAAFIGLVFWLVYAFSTSGPQPFIYFQF